MRFAIQCVLASNVSQKRLNLRATHLKFLEANKERIFCGGPIVDLDGQPEMMLIILNAPDRLSAEAFIKAEPYNQSGIFERVTINEWRQVLPEVRSGELLQAIESEN
jgi:uncharacterized protein